MARSRGAARDFLQPGCRRAATAMEARFTMLGSQLRADMDEFASGRPLGLALRKELLSYATALLVLKTLESRHHLIQQAISRGRALSVASVSADLRRKHNRDLHRDDFQADLPSLLESLGTLTCMPWRTRTELVNAIVGQTYRGLHDDLSAQADYYKRFREFLKHQASTRQRSPDFLLQSAHLESLLVESNYYGMPVDRSAIGRGTQVFQVLALHPGRRQYVQRAAHVSSDAPCLNFCTLFWDALGVVPAFFQ